MKIKKLFGLRVIILLIVLFFAVLAINYNPYAAGIQIKSVEGVAADNGLKAGQIVQTVNGKEITSVDEFNKILDDSFKSKTADFEIETDAGNYSFSSKDKLGFEAFNLSIVKVDEGIPLKQGEKILKINGELIDSNEKYFEVVNKIMPKNVYKFVTSDGEFAFLSYEKPDVIVRIAAKSNLKKGLDLEGGTRVLLEPKNEEGGEVTDSQVQDLISVLGNRLDVYGLSDLRIRGANDLEGNKFVLVEIAGATKEEVSELIAKQGVFEAKIGNDTVFEGGNKDITFVCRGDGSCSGVRDCYDVGQNQASCRFEFAIHLSPEAAKKHADVTKNIDVITEGSQSYLSKKIDFYLDKKLVDSLNVAADLKGKETTAIAISGPGFGVNQQEAYNDAVKNMDRLQTILITGSLPLKPEIVKLDTISPIFGKEFISNAWLVGILAIASVAVVIFIRYRKLKIIIPMMFISFSEAILTLGFAALINWNLDLVSIAGIIAAVGTGIDDQIVVVDETLRGDKEEAYMNLKEKNQESICNSICCICHNCCCYAAIALGRSRIIKRICCHNIGWNSYRHCDNKTCICKHYKSAV